MIRLSRFAFVCLLTTAVSDVGAAEAPSAWTDADTGHRVYRLSQEPGSANLYFHQNSYNPAGTEMVITGPAGISVVDLQTRAVRLLVPGVGTTTDSSAGILVGRKTGQVYYTKKVGADTFVFATGMDSGATRQIAKIPAGGTFSSLNADETLLVGVMADGGVPFGIQLPPPGTTLPVINGPDGQPLTFAEIKEVRMNDRLEQHLPMSLYTINTSTGEMKTLLKATDWLGHVQFSPTDPNLLMYCHEGPWHKVDRIWTMQADGTGAKLIHPRTMNMEIAGHEFFSADGKTIWYDLQTPRGEDFWVAGYELASGRRTWYHLQRNEWSVHFNVSRDGALFAGDGGDNEMVAHAPDGKWIYVFRPQTIPDVAGLHAPNAETLIHAGFFKSERLVNLGAHNYQLEPNVSITPDNRWIIFRSNMQGPSQVFAVEIADASPAPAVPHR